MKNRGGGGGVDGRLKHRVEQVSANHVHSQSAVATTFNTVIHNNEPFCASYFRHIQ